MSLKATPTPARYSHPLSSSRRCGSTTAAAAGSTSRGLWWSVITTSSPSEEAYSTSPIAVMPLSTVMTRRTPSSWMSFSASRLRP